VTVEMPLLDTEWAMRCAPQYGTEAEVIAGETARLALRTICQSSARLGDRPARIKPRRLNSTVGCTVRPPLQCSPRLTNGTTVVETEISRERATEIGAIEIALRGLGSGAHPALLSAELEFRAPILYNVDLETCWLVYAKQEGSMLRSSNVVLVDRRTATVRYAGSANDEG
jgi:hypothetical protein